MVQEAEEAGVIEGHERELISGIMRLADRQVRGVMTPRREVDWLDANAPEAEIRARLIATPHTRLLVGEGTIDRILGVNFWPPTRQPSSRRRLPATSTATISASGRQ